MIHRDNVDESFELCPRIVDQTRIEVVKLCWNVRNCFGLTRKLDLVAVGLTAGKRGSELSGVKRKWSVLLSGCCSVAVVVEFPDQRPSLMNNRREEGRVTNLEVVSLPGPGFSSRRCRSWSESRWSPSRWRRRMRCCCCLASPGPRRSRCRNVVETTADPSVMDSKALILIKKHYCFWKLTDM